MTRSDPIAPSKGRVRDSGKHAERVLASAPHRDRDRHIDALLDAALADTFPASDPVAISHNGRSDRQTPR